MPTPGRNDPCPCGSGRKFKRCCGAASERPAAGASYTEADQARALGRLNAYSIRPELDELRLVAEVEFWGPRASEIPLAERERLAGLEMVQINFQSFFVQEFV